MFFSLSFQQDSEFENRSRRNVSLEKRIIGGNNAAQADWWFIGLYLTYKTFALRVMTHNL